MLWCMVHDACMCLHVYTFIVYWTLTSNSNIWECEKSNMLDKNPYKSCWSREKNPYQSCWSREKAISCTPCVRCIKISLIICLLLCFIISPTKTDMNITQMWNYSKFTLSAKQGVVTAICPVLLSATAIWSHYTVRKRKKGVCNRILVCLLQKN